MPGKLAHAARCYWFVGSKAEFKAHDPSARKSRQRILALNHSNLFFFNGLR